MTWRMEFYNERQGILARYDVEAVLPAEAVLQGRTALLAEYPSMPRSRRPSLLERAQRAGGRDAGGWILYRLVRDSEHGPAGVAQPQAA